MTINSIRVNSKTMFFNSSKTFLCNLLPYKPINVKMSATRKIWLSSTRSDSSPDIEREMYSRCNEFRTLKVCAFMISPSEMMISSFCTMP